MVMRYLARLTPNGAGYVIQFDDVPEAITEGATRDEALENAGDALAVALLGYMQDGGQLPKPSDLTGGSLRHWVNVPAQTAAKLLFYEAFKTSGISRVALAKKLGKDEAEIRRML